MLLSPLLEIIRLKYSESKVHTQIAQILQTSDYISKPQNTNTYQSIDISANTGNVPCLKKILILLERPP